MNALLRSGPLQRFGLGLGVWPIAFFSFFLVATALSRAVGIVAPWGMAALALVAAALAVQWSLRLSLRLFLAALLSAGLLGLLAVTLAGAWRDISYDGQAIHFPSALEIAAGHNPITTRPFGYFSAVYPNGLWTLQALFIVLSSGFEEGKAPAGMLALASIPLIALALHALRGAWTPAVVLAAVAVQANPVLLLQLTSFELDGVVYSLVVIAIAGAILLTTPHRRAGLVAFCGACLLLVNTKITGLYWAGIVCAGALLQMWLVHRRLPRRFAATLALTLAVSTLAVGWRPYASVPLETGKLFGASTEVVHGPANLRDAGPLARAAFLLFGRPGNPAGAETAALKWPWDILADRDTVLLDIRIGGFGAGFGLQVLGALLAGAACLWSGRRAWWRDGAWLGPFWTGVVAIATLLFPVSWWARLVAPFWLVAVLPLVWATRRPDLSRPSASHLFHAGWAMSLAGLVATGTATLASLHSMRATNQAISHVLGDLTAQGASVRIVPGSPIEQDQTPLVWQQRLIHAGIYPHTGPAEGCSRDLFPVGSVRLCVDQGAR